MAKRQYVLHGQDCAVHQYRRKSESNGGRTIIRLMINMYCKNQS